jgi:hypothetical protein
MSRFAEEWERESLGLNKPLPEDRLKPLKRQDKPDPPKPLPKRLMLDEIMAMVSEIAQDADAGADRFRALKMLATSEQATAILPHPMSGKDIIYRLSRLMRASGTDLCQQAYVAAFPKKRAGELDDAPTVDVTDLDIDYDKLPKTVRAFHRMFPELKNPKGGCPPNYPRAGKIVQVEWLRRESIKILRDKKQKELDDRAKELQAQDEVIRKDAPVGDTGTSPQGDQAQ